MFRKQVNPKVAAVVTIVTLAAIQWFYWRNLVYRPPSPGTQMMGGGGPMLNETATLGSELVRVENWIGDEPGYRDGPKWQAQLAGPNALAFDKDGNLLVADSRNHCIRAVSPAGRVSTLAGGGPAGGGNALGAATAARFRYPSGVSVLPDGTVVVADTGNHRLCAVNAGQVTLLAGGAAGLADGAGPAARFNSPGPMAIDKSGRLWVVDSGNGKLRAVTAAGAVSTPADVPVEVREVLGLVLSAPARTIWGSIDGKAPPVASKHRTGRCGSGVLLASGARVFGDVSNHVVYFQQEGADPVLLAGRISPTGPIVGNTEETGVRASFATPAAVAAGRDGVLYIADYDNDQIRRLRLAGSPYQ